MQDLLNNRFVQIALVVLALYLLFSYMNKKEYLTEISQEAISQEEIPNLTLSQTDAPTQQTTPEMESSESKIQPEQLLPKYSEANEFALQNPVSKLLQEQNFLVSGYHIGINTILQSNKIPYHDIRSLPPIQSNMNITPFYTSSYEQPIAAKRKRIDL